MRTSSCSRLFETVSNDHNPRNLGLPKKRQPNPDGLAKQKPGDMHTGTWNGLGGKLLQGESSEKCAIRAVREESGPEIRNPRLHGLIMFPGFKEDDWHVFVFTTGDFKGKLIESDEGLLEWIPDENMKKLSLWDSDHIFFDWMKQDKFFSAKFIYTGKTLVSHDVTFY